MHIKIFMATANNMQEREILKDFAKGVESWIGENSDDKEKFDHVIRIGRWADFNFDRNQITYEYAESYKECDVAVFFGSWKPREKGTHLVRSHVAANARRFVCIETPLLNRVTDKENSYWRVGVNGFLSQDAHWPELPNNDAKKRLEMLNINWAGWKSNPDGHILVALQLPGDASLRGADINDWALRTILDIRQNTKRFVVVRNHPLSSQRAFADHEELARKLLLAGVQNIRFSDGAEVPWSDDLRNAYCTVTYTSGLAIDSVLSGIPTLACDNGNFAWPFSSHYLEEIERLQMADSDTINTWLRHLAQCQYSVEEMQSGVAWSCLIDPVNTILEKNAKSGKKK
jgi:hypothetical protein